MPKFTKQQLEKQYDKLPEILKDALFSAEIANKMFEIGKRISLTIEEIGHVAEETGHVILGLTRPENFEHEIEERLNVDEEEAQKITREVNKEVFFPLREALKATHQIEITEVTSDKQQVTSRVEPITTVPKPMPPQQPKIEAPSIPRPSPLPQPTRPPAPTPLQPKAAMPTPPPVQESRIMKQELREEKITPPAPKPIEPVGPPEPIKPPPATSKVPPIDLRRSKPERMREAIFAPPVEPESRSKNQAVRDDAASAPAKSVETPKSAEKKAPYGGYDPYKEPVE